MKPLKGTKTHDNLKAAFAGESQANRRYLYFAQQGRRRRPERRRRAVPLDRRRRDRAMRTATSTTSQRSAIRRPTCRSAHAATT